MKATVICNGQEKEVELTDEQVKEFGFKESKVWKPKDEEEYFWKDSIGNIHIDYWYGSSVDMERYDIGNCYSTKEQAEFERDCQLYLTKYKRWLDEYNDPIDWNNSEQRKWYAYYDYYRRGMGYSFTFSCKKQGSLYATSEQIIDDFKNEIGEEIFKKYILRVED